MIVNSYLLTLSVLILGASYLFRRLQRKLRVEQELPMPDLKQASWIWGHEFKIFQHEACEMYIEWAASLGSMYRIKAALFQPEIIIVGDNSAAHHILQNCYTSYVRAPAFLGLLRSHLGNGLGTVEGEDHKYQRRLLAPAFTSGAVDAMADDIFSCVDKMTQDLRSTLIDPGKTNGSIVDMVPIMSACTLDIIGRVGFGHDFECGKSTEAKAIISAWHQDVVKLQTFAGFMAPILINIFPWITRLPIAAFQDGVIKRIVHRLAGTFLPSDNSMNTGLFGNDILSLLLKSDQNMEDKSEPRFTTTELLDNITTLLMAGHETTAITVDFILLHLAQNPRIQRKLQQEIRTMPSLNYNSIVGLEYLEAVAKEGLRLHPVGGLTDRVALQDDVIPLQHAIDTESEEIVSSLAVKAGQVFRIPWVVLNVNKQVWGNNASEFIPERWIEPGGVPPLDELPHGPWGGISSFSDGPRSCIGYRLGVLELKIIIAVLVRSFDFECTEAKIVQRLSPSLQPFADGKAGSMPLKVSLAPEL